MPRFKTGFCLLLLVIIFGLFLMQVHVVQADRLGQIPTVSIPTVTSSPMGASVTVTRDQDQINVRSGPSTDYPIVGVLIAGQQVPALGRSLGGQWIQVVYPGGPDGVAWVYSPLVEASGTMPIIEPPPTPTPRTTPTIDPTLAAQFIVEVQPTRLPTFTAPPPLALPTFADPTGVGVTRRIPMGLLIVGLGVIGLFGTLISFLRSR
jgi:drug/metabolite transporter (DMT)-like permease